MSIGEWKERAAALAASFVEDGMKIGIGHGTTVQKILEELGRRKPRVEIVPASKLTERKARELGLALADLEKCPVLDLVLDGADEVDPRLNAVKGRGGALTREKILCKSARRVVFVVDRTKLVRELSAPVPVEVIPFAAGVARRGLEGLGGKPELRLVHGEPFVTDNGNYIFDTRFESLGDPADMERRINQIPGVVENGIFPGMADQLVVGYEEGAKLISTEDEFLRFLANIG